MNIHALLPCALLAAAIPAQDDAKPLNPRAFLPSDYRGEFYVDLHALRETGVWDGVRSSILLAPILGMFSNEFGFELEDVDRMRFALDLADGEPTPKQVGIIEGDESVGIPEFADQGSRQIENVSIGGRDAVATTYVGADAPHMLYHAPKPGVLVFGADALIRPVLEGERRGGVPSGELLSLISGRGVLAYAVFGLTGDMRNDLPPFMDKDWLTDEDPLTHMAMRLRKVDAEEGEVEFRLEAVLRCAEGTAGPERLETKVREGLESLKSHRQLGALKRYWENVVVQRDGTDVTLRMDLGKSRRAGATFATLLAPMMITGRVEEQQIQPVPAQAVEPQKAQRREGKREGKREEQRER